MKAGLSREDTPCISKRTIGINRIATRLRRIWPPSLIGNTNQFKTLTSLYLLLVHTFHVDSLKISKHLFILLRHCFETAFLALFYMLIYLLLFSTVPYLLIILCTSIFLVNESITSSFHHHVSPLLLLSIYFSHISSHIPKILSLNNPNKW